MTRDVEARAKTGAAAERALLVRLRDRSTPSGDEIHPDTRIDQLGELWLAEVEAEERVLPQTVGRYRTAVDTIRTGLGGLRIREASVGRLDRFLKGIAVEHPAKARNIKSALGQMLGLAVRHDALRANPIRDVGRIRHRRRPVRSLTLHEVSAIRTAIRCWQDTPAGRSGPRHTGDLADIVDLLLATGGRIGEMLAVRWSDLDLAAARPTLTFSGTIVFVKGGGLFRQPWPKTEAGYRTLVLPRFAVDILLGRQVNASATSTDAIFPSRRGTWLPPANVRRQWRLARAGTGLEWVTPHVFRKAVATLLDREVSTRAASKQLGHSTEGVTLTHYIEKAYRAPDVSEILQQFAA